MTTPDALRAALAEALHAAGIGCMRPVPVCDPSLFAYADFHPAQADAILAHPAVAAALAGSGPARVQWQDDCRCWHDCPNPKGRYPTRLAESGPAAGLDVERLYDALIAVTRPQIFPGDKGADAWRRKTAEAIAHEYAATPTASPTDVRRWLRHDDECPRSVAILADEPCACGLDEAVHEHYWVDAPDDETGWHCTICGLTEYPGDPGIGGAASPTATGEREP